ncbi:MAG: YmdB family metallophosphoesterase [Campylobacterales bacterium]|nr:YmdB family metallophosphoesterase [Campylobacterales bacterium]
MRVAFIGDIVGRPGRDIIKDNLKKMRVDEKIDFVIANCENASHGFGLTSKNANELFSYGIDILTGGNHTWDKKEIIPLLDTMPILRPLNYPDGVAGNGIKIIQVKDEQLAVINLMGMYGMPQVLNPFTCAKDIVNRLLDEGVKNIFIDFHAETTSEKRTMFEMLKGKISVVVGTHTHVGTDDLMIQNGSCFLTDIGLTGCRDNVIGMESSAPIYRFLTGLPAKFDVPDKCKKILQMLIVDIEDGICLNAFKLKKYCNKDEVIKTDAIFEQF